MRTGRPKVALILATDERQRLESLAHRSRSAPHLARRARIILACADGTDSNVVARRLHVTPATVCKWRGRFVQHRLDGLHDEPRPGAQRTITDEQVEQVVIRTLETTPRGATHWSTREMAKAVGLSHTAISRIWHTFGLQPHRSETFKLSTDPLLIEQVRDIVGLYLDPPAHAAVFCVDEKPQIQALDRTQPLLPMQPGQVERRTHDYKRHGTTTLFAALNAQTSEVITQFHQRHRSAQFREFLDLIDERVPRHLDVHIIMDNYGTHKTALIRNWFAKRPRFHVHFTPTYGSWLSLVERWFAELTMKRIRRGAFRSVPQLKAAIQEFIEAHQINPKPFVWTKSADEILASVARFAQRTLGARGALQMSRTTVTGHYQQVSLRKVRLQHSIVTHHLPLYFPEAERYLHSSRAEWFTDLLLFTPCPAEVRRYTKAAFVAAAREQIAGRNVDKARWLADFYDTAATSLGLPVSESSEAMGMFRIVLEEYRALCVLRERLEADVVARLAHQPDFIRLQTLPGIGPILAMIILAEARVNAPAPVTERVSQCAPRPRCRHRCLTEASRFPARVSLIRSDSDAQIHKSHSTANSGRISDMKTEKFLASSDISSVIALATPENGSERMKESERIRKR